MSSQTRTWTRKDGTVVTKTYEYPPDYKPTTAEERFFAKVDKEHASGCWLWTAGTSSDGYGRFSENCRGVNAHRWSWQFHFGRIPNGLLVLHSCDVPRCVNPEHLFLGTPADNCHDMVDKGRHCTQTGTQNCNTGEDNPTSKITWERVREMRELYQSGNYSQRELAEHFDLSQSTVNHILQGKTWRRSITG